MCVIHQNLMWSVSWMELVCTEWAYLQVYTCRNVHEYTHTRATYIHIHTYKRIYTHIHTCIIHTYTYMHIYIYTYIHIYTHTSPTLHTYIHTHIHTYINKYTHIHTNTHTHTHTDKVEAIQIGEIQLGSYVCMGQVPCRDSWKRTGWSTGQNSGAGRRYDNILQLNTFEHAVPGARMATKLGGKP